MYKKQDYFFYLNDVDILISIIIYFINDKWMKIKS